MDFKMEKRQRIISLLIEGRDAANNHHLQASAKAHLEIVKLIAPKSEEEQADLEEMIALFISGQSYLTADETADKLTDRHPEVWYMQIKIVERGNPLIESALSLVEREALSSWAILFGGDRWHYVEWCAVALDNEGQPVGLASLAPTDEMGDGGPNVIGLWVAPSYRRQRIGMALVVQLAAESWKRYGKGATMEAVTKAAVGLANKLYEENVPITCKNVGFGELP